MQWTDQIRNVKISLVITAVLIAGASLFVSHSLIKDLQAEEHRKMGIWAEAMRTIIRADENTDLSLTLKVLDSNHTIPVIVLDNNGNVLETRNLKVRNSTESDSIASVLQEAREMEAAGNTMKIYLGEDTSEASSDYIVIDYGESIMLQRLAGYPFVQLGIVALFIVVAIIALMSSKRAEQNKVWVGLSRETAHQLGTPVSSLMAWSAILRENHPDDELIPEMENDIKRLELITERFSKIGSKPEPKETCLNELLETTVLYMRRRASERIEVLCELPSQQVMTNLCASLFQWVIESLCKNAIDAMPAQGGKIIVTLPEPQHEKIVIYVRDTGKGINRKDFKNVFKPGFTTKKRGWGLGLSLAKRIVEEYHHGKIFVKESVPDQGTTFCIELPNDLQA